jgi:hypothetical protein
VLGPINFASSGAGTAYPSGGPEFTPSFWWGSCFNFMCNFYGSLFVLFAIVLSVLLRFMDSDYPFKLFYDFPIVFLVFHFISHGTLFNYLNKRWRKLKGAIKNEQSIQRHMQHWAQR